MDGKNSEEISLCMDFFSWGSNSHGQLGTGQDLEQYLTPHKVIRNNNLNLSQVVKITGGGSHTILLSSTGQFYSCGNNKQGQLGLRENGKPSNIFSECLFSVKIKEVACGWDFNLALSDTNIVYGWGSNSFGQLGFSFENVKKIHEPEKLAIGRGVAVAAGLRHSVVLCEDLKLYTCGFGKKGQLGLLTCDAKHDKFTQVPDLAGVIKITCGQHNTLVLNKMGELFACGDNTYSQLGIDSELMPLSSKFIKMNYSGEAIQEIYFGWTHACVQTISGKIKCWGRNAYGQLGTHDTNAKAAVTADIPDVIQFVAGSEHCTALTKNNTVICWGWNEHGNCGNNKTDNLFEPTNVSFDNDLKPIMIGGGAAHTFAIVTK